MGIKNIIRFGMNIPFISNDDIKAMQMTEKISKINPIISKIQIGQDVLVSGGSLKESIVKICSLPLKKRVSILLTFLVTERKISIPEKDIIFQ